MKCKTIALAGCLLLAAAAFTQASAQGNVRAKPQERVLRGSQITEDAVTELLAIPGPADPEGQKRGFSPRIVRSPQDSSGRGSGPGRAALLITFQTDSADLADESKTAVDTLARALQSDKLAGFSFKVEGHADPRGSEEHNQLLSQRRAETVVKYLISQHGILPERLSAAGKGSAELMDPRHPEAPENRRVTIVTKRE